MTALDDCRDSDVWCEAMLALMRRHRLPRGYADERLAHHKLMLELQMSARRSGLRRIDYITELVNSPFTNAGAHSK